MARIKPDVPPRIILLTQELGVALGPSGELTTHGKESTARIDHMLKAQGAEVLQLQISQCEIQGDKVFYHGHAAEGAIPAVPAGEIDLSHYQGVMKRSWDGAFNANHGTEVQAVMEKAGLYGDNPSSFQRKTHDREVMQTCMEQAGLSTPKTWVIKGAASLTGSVLDELAALHAEKGLDRDQHPAFVLKEKQGTAGNGIRFYTLGETADMLEAVKAATPEAPLVLQEFIPSTLIPDAPQEDVKNAAHYRVILTRDSKYADYTIAGGLHLQRSGAWVSNASAKEGISHKMPLDPAVFTPEFVGALKYCSRVMGANQCGWDVIRAPNGKSYALETNDSMGVTGPMLEGQGVLHAYASNFLSRVQEHMQAKMQEASPWVQRVSPRAQETSVGTARSVGGF